MKNSTHQQAQSWNDLVFENRNKTFGAYQLREDYNRNIILALLLCAGFVTLVFMMPKIASLLGWHENTIPKMPPIISVSGLILTPRIIPIEKPAKPKELITKVKNTNIVPLVTTKTVIDEPTLSIEPTIIDEPTSNIGATSVGVSLPIEPQVITKINEPYISVEIMPSYEGGLEGLYKFLGKNLSYPNIDKRNGTEGTVFVQFVINELGSVTQIEVIKGINNTLDKEAVRVISLMKQWKPGIQNHEAVSVKMVVPIKFRLSS
jgi:periplasmic protein TonB